MYRFVAITGADTFRDKSLRKSRAAIARRNLMIDQPHILVVDDHREIRDSVTRYLEKNGIEDVNQLIGSLDTEHHPLC